MRKTVFIVAVALLCSGRRMSAPLRYQNEAKPKKARKNELLTVSIRYKQPDGRRSSLLSVPVLDGGGSIDRAGADLRFASAVAAFGMVLRESPHKGAATLDAVLQLAEGAKGADPYREEFVGLVVRARSLEPLR